MRLTRLIQSSRGGVLRSSLPAPSRVLSVGRDPGSREAPDAPTRGVPKSRPLEVLALSRICIASGSEGHSYRIALDGLAAITAVTPTRGEIA